ncbi:glycoside hydrolase family 25 [Lactobacillus salivarius]|uniref:GH25 family lysozyme n=1 Tax=Ligilactobacillus salivarius TaxID=1624 RepID=UPI00136A6AAD|nr:GH25 family lysozyme [Ligilactobacillus salivarius]MYY89420.1 glycoside hydrolase family 25 [Ligilactobacillus salivarius]
MVMYTVDVYSGSDDSIIRDPHAQGVIVKATQGTGYVNPKCNHQWDLAGQLGKKRGLYHYAGGGSPVAEAQYFINNIKNYVEQGMLIIDWEGYQNSAWGNSSWVRQFVDEVHRLTGVWCVIYVQESALNQVANCAKDCAVWVAKYASMNWNSWTVPDMSVSSDAFGSIAGWRQYTGGDMDRSIWYLDANAWDKFAKPSDEKTQIETPKPVPAPSQNDVKYDSWTDDLGVKWFKESGKFTITVDEGIVLRWGATTSSSEIAVLPKGSVVEYDAFAHSGGYVWIRQPRGNGQFGYLPTGEDRNGTRLNYWGKFTE